MPVHVMALTLSPPQRLLKNMKFEGIEIALESIWYEDSRLKSVCGRGERKEKIAEASARFMSQYGVKPGGRRDSCRFSSSLEKWLSCV